jgi:hypothetical protein
MIYEILRYDIVKGVQSEYCITDGTDLKAVIYAAEEYLEEQYAIDGLWGYHEASYTLRMTDDDDKVLEREITLKVDVQCDTREADSRHWRDLGRYL